MQNTTGHLTKCSPNADIRLFYAISNYIKNIWHFTIFTITYHANKLSSITICNIQLHYYIFVMCNIIFILCTKVSFFLNFTMHIRCLD